MCKCNVPVIVTYKSAKRDYNSFVSHFKCILTIIYLFTIISFYKQLYKFVQSEKQLECHGNSLFVTLWFTFVARTAPSVPFSLI